MILTKKRIIAALCLAAATAVFIVVLSIANRDIPKQTFNYNAYVLENKAEVNEGISTLPLGIYLKVTDYKGGMVTCVLSNQSGYDMMYGHEYYLQKKINGEWTDLEPVVSIGWTRDILGIKDLEEVTLEYDLKPYGEITEGEYKLLKNDLEAEFTLVKK